MYRLHRSHERNARVVQLKKEQALGLHGRLNCEVCGLDFETDTVPSGAGSSNVTTSFRSPSLGAHSATRLERFGSGLLELPPDAPPRCRHAPSAGAVRPRRAKEGRAGSSPEAGETMTLREIPDRTVSARSNGPNPRGRNGLSQPVTTGCHSLPCMAAMDEKTMPRRALRDLECPGCKAVQEAEAGEAAAATEFAKCLRRCDKCGIGSSNGTNRPVEILADALEKSPGEVRPLLSLAIDSGLNATNHKNKRSTIGFRTSEDAVTWTVFRYLHQSRRLQWFGERVGLTAAGPCEPTLLLWG